MTTETTHLVGFVPVFVAEVTIKPPPPVIVESTTITLATQYNVQYSRGDSRESDDCCECEITRDNFPRFCFLLLLAAAMLASFIAPLASLKSGPGLYLPGYRGCYVNGTDWRNGKLVFYSRDYVFSVGLYSTDDVCLRAANASAVPRFQQSECNLLRSNAITHRMITVSSAIGIVCATILTIGISEQLAGIHGIIGFIIIAMNIVQYAAVLNIVAHMKKIKGSSLQIDKVGIVTIISAACGNIIEVALIFVRIHLDTHR